MTSTQRYFDRHARAFDRLYARPGAAAFLRCGPRRGCELAVAVVAQHAAPSVLDVGCGPGRVAEAVIRAGAASYVGVDLSPRMLALARRRLRGCESVQLLEGDFLESGVSQTFDVVLALGLFEYLDDPARAAAWLRARCSSALVASFTRWDWVKGPVRRLRYEVVHRCPVHDYTEAGVAELLATAGFSNVRFDWRGRRGFLVSAAP
jgi:SAM-dependent methyltransferase